MLAKINKWGNSHGVRLSRAILNEANFLDAENVEVIVKPGIIEIRKVKTDITLKDIFAGYSGPKANETDWGKSEGREEW